MAEKRMFAKSIVLTDAFLDMPMSARCLYFTLGMLADDDGFVGSPKSIMRQCGASQDDLMCLLTKRFVLGFESGVIVIKHWRINNYLQNDRYHPTTYQEELATLMLDEKGSYTESRETPCVTGSEPMYTGCIQDVYPDKNRLDKDRLEKNSKDRRFTPPTVEEVRTYCQERKNTVDPETFVDFYTSKGWKVGSNPMKDWKAAVRTWERNRNGQSRHPQNAGNGSEKWNVRYARDPR